MPPDLQENKPREIQTIQVLRFFAASAVVLVHTASGHFFIGSTGVDVFFVISGFIITRILTSRTPSAFLWDRFTRIYPIYWVLSAPLVLVFWQPDNLAKLAASVTLWPWFGHFERQYLNPAWTLSFEMLFYAATAIFLLNRRLLPALLIAYITCLVAAFITKNPVLMFLGNPLAIEFGFGVLIAMTSKNIGRSSRRAKHIAIGLLLVAPVAMIAFSQHSFGIIEQQFNLEAAWRPLAWGVPAAAIVWAFLQFERPRNNQVWNALRYGGDASYSIYLSQALAIAFLVPTNPYLKLAASPLVILFGVAIHRYIEKPLLRSVRTNVHGSAVTIPG